MSLSLLIDVSVGTIATRWLKGQFQDVVAVRDYDPRMLDQDILAWAVREERIVVTMDKDFGELVFRNQLPHHGVLLLRLESETSRRKIEVLEYILENFAADLEGNFCVYQHGHLRISP